MWHPPACGRRRLVTFRRGSPPLPWSGGCHMLAKQAVLAEPSEASTARPKGPVPPAARQRAAAAATAQRTGPPLRGALSWARGVQLALLPRCARKHVAPAGLWPAATCDIPTQHAAGLSSTATCDIPTQDAAGLSSAATCDIPTQNAAGLSSAATCDIPTQDAAAPLERRVPHACAASSASRTIRSVDSAARRAGPASSTNGSGRSRESPRCAPPAPKGAAAAARARDALHQHQRERPQPRPLKLTTKQAPLARGLFQCPGEDSNLQGCYTTSTSSWRVCQFRHLGRWGPERFGALREDGNSSRIGVRKQPP